jgi:hypothetical protein
MLMEKTTKKTSQIAIALVLVASCAATVFGEETRSSDDDSQKPVAGSVVCKITDYQGKPTMFIDSEPRKGDCGNFLDPQKSRLVIEYRKFHSDEVVDSAVALCKAVKEESGGRLMTGLYYGYTRIWTMRTYCSCSLECRRSETRAYT